LRYVLLLNGVDEDADETSCVLDVLEAAADLIINLKTANERRRSWDFRSTGASFSQRYVFPIDENRISGNNPSCVVGEERRRCADILNAEQAARGRVVWGRNSPGGSVSWMNCVVEIDAGQDGKHVSLQEGDQKFERGQRNGQRER
jgi:hypothetical protein